MFDRNCYETPPWLFKALDKEFRFTFDLAATPRTSKCKRFFEPKDDSLTQDWHKLKGWLWLNPPYSPLKVWMKKAQRENQLGAKIVVLAPPILCTSYLRNWFPQEIRLIVGRVSFLADGVERKGNRDDSALFVFGDHKVVSPKVTWLSRDELRS